MQAPRVSQLLTYVVEQAIRESGSVLKEYTIAVEVFSRPESFDPVRDSIVRVETRLLRSKLKEYYRHAAEDRIEIELPRRTYVPVFRMRERWPACVAQLGPTVKSVAILPFNDLNPAGKPGFATTFAEELVAALHSTGAVGIFDWHEGLPSDARTCNPLTAASRLDVEAVLSGTISRVARTVWLVARLLRAKDGALLWSQEVEKSARSVIGAERQIANEIAEAISAWVVPRLDVAAAPKATLALVPR